MMMMMMMISHPLSPGPVDPSFHDLSGSESQCRWHFCEDWPNALIVAQSKGCHVVAECKVLLENLRTDMPVKIGMEPKKMLVCKLGKSGFPEIPACSGSMILPNGQRCNLSECE